MENVIRMRKGTNGPLGEVRTIEGPEATELFRLVAIRAALNFFAQTGMKIHPNFSMKLVKSVTGLKARNPQTHLDKMDELIEAQRAKVTYVHE